MTGDRLGLTTINPKDEMSWMNYKDDNKLIHNLNYWEKGDRLAKYSLFIPLDSYL